VLGLSTAYIANRADITFWELGAVHRGEPWRTINLKAYKSNNTGRSYTDDGDAVLLDQLKLGGFIEVQGRINANSADAYVWKSLLDQVEIGWDYADLIDPAILTPDSVMFVNSTAMANDIATETNSEAPFQSRAKFVNLENAGSAKIFVDGIGGTQTNDRAQEEIIGKIANLLTVRQNIFTVLVTAQTVLDTGPNDPGGSRSVMYDSTPGNEKYCLIQAEHKLLATVYRDAFTNTFRVINVETLED
jgi:hypothetical protein